MKSTILASAAALLVLPYARAGLSLTSINSFGDTDPKNGFAPYYKSVASTTLLELTPSGPWEYFSFNRRSSSVEVTPTSLGNTLMAQT